MTLRRCLMMELPAPARRRATIIVARTLIATIVFSFLAGNAAADSPPNPEPPQVPSSKAGEASLGTITVEAQRQREAIKQQVSKFVSSVVIRGFDESVASWQTPICPMVAGLPHDDGEFILRRVSQAVQNAGALLAPRKCNANLIVIVTAEPDLLLKKWWNRDPRLFNTTRGLGAIKRFLNAQQPVRIWYNANSGCPGLLSSGLGVSATGWGASFYPTCSMDAPVGKLAQTARVIESVIVVVDTGRIKGLNIGQLADYIAMVGLAQIRLDSDLGSAPTILRLFAQTDHDAMPQSLSNWDESFLKSLYHTNPKSVVQISQMETKMLGDIDANAAR